MSKTAMVRARIEPSLKEEAESILKELGLSASEVITLLYKQISLQKGLPFEVKIPNAVTIAAMREALESKELKTYNSFSELLDEIEDEPE
jgi:DNA-damage-inducible protein J